MKKLRIVLSGQKHFGKEVLKSLIDQGHEVVAVCVPLDDSYLLPYASQSGIKIIPGGNLCADTMPQDIDLGVCAHSFDYVGKRTRYMAKHGWIGYHPSLLPRHRGRSSIEWALRFKDIITGGTVYWLNSGIDRGDIERQHWVWLDHSQTAREVWREKLQPLGIILLRDAVADIAAGIINRMPQDLKFSTFEPSLDNVKDLYRPDLLMLNAKNE